MPELRKDPVLGRWVIIATERARRPSDFAAPAPPEPGPARPCPFCPGNERETPPEITRRPAGNSGWAVRVVPNRFPALDSGGEPVRRGAGIYDRIAGVGAHEVVIETPDHDAGLADLGPDRLAVVLDVYRERAVALAGDPRLRYVLVFKNHGPGAGASLSHCHAQIIATPVVPVLVEEELAGAARYFEFRKRCVYCDVVRQELRDRSRLVYENDGFVVVAPFASRFPFETWLVPRRHFASFEELDPGLTGHLADALDRTLVRLRATLGDPDYNFFFHVAPGNGPGPEHYHFHVELMPKLTRVAGFEVGSGFYINPVPPEDAARYLRGDDENRPSGV